MGDKVDDELLCRCGRLLHIEREGLHVCPHCHIHWWVSKELRGDAGSACVIVEEVQSEEGDATDG